MLWTIVAPCSTAAFNHSSFSPSDISFQGLSSQLVDSSAAANAGTARCSEQR
jgi:hypothetical protein